MPAGAVVVHLDPLEGGLLHRFQVRPGPGVDEFFLVRREEALRDGIVIADTGPAQRAADPVPPAEAGEIVRRVLRAAIGMEDDLAFRPALFEGHRQGVGDQLGAHVVSDRPPDHPPRMQVWSVPEKVEA